MSFATLATLEVISATLAVPRIGVWHAEVELGDVDASTLVGSLTLAIDDGASQWVGTPARPPVNAFGRTRVRLVGGHGGLRTTVPGQSYAGNAPASVPLRDLLAAAGERLATTADPGLLATSLPAWSRLAGLASRQLSDIVDEVAGTWRVLADGSIWIGLESWPDAPAFEFDLLEQVPEYGRWVLGATAAYVLLPGMTFQGQRVEYVAHQLSADRLRTAVIFA